MKDFSSWTDKEIYNLVLKGLKNNILNIVYSKDSLKHGGCDGICCQCGETFFYFADNDDYKSAKDFIKNTDMRNNARDITDVIHDFLSDPDDAEGKYILSYISERLSVLEPSR